MEINDLTACVVFSIVAVIFSACVLCLIVSIGCYFSDRKARRQYEGWKGKK